MENTLKEKLLDAFNHNLENGKGEAIVIGVKGDDKEVVSQIQQAMVTAGDETTQKISISYDKLYEVIISIDNPHVLLTPIKILEAHEKINTLKKLNEEGGILHIFFGDKKEMCDKSEIVLKFLNNIRNDVQLGKIISVVSCDDNILQNFLTKIQDTTSKNQPSEMRGVESLVETLKKEISVSGDGGDNKTIENESNYVNYFTGNKTLH